MHPKLQWYTGTLVRCYSGTMVHQYTYTVLHWHRQWYNGTLVCSRTILHLYTGKLVQWYIQWYNGIVIHQYTSNSTCDTPHSPLASAPRYEQCQSSLQYRVEYSCRIEFLLCTTQCTSYYSYQYEMDHCLFWLFMYSYNR